MPSSAWTFCLAVMLFSWLAPQGARADEVRGPAGEPAPADIATARRLFAEAHAAADAGELADALARFVECYGLSGNPAALYNVARTLRALGRHVEAAAAFDQLLRSHHELAAETRADAVALREEESSRIATLLVDELPPASDALVLRIDGSTRSDPRQRPALFELDPGAHGLVVTLPLHRPFTWEGALGDGERRVVTVLLEPEPVGRSLAEEPLLWISIGVVLLAGAALGGWAAWDAAQLRPESAGVIRL